jgi:hypothetical protein
MTDHVLLLAPPKILLENAEDEWLDATGAEVTILTCRSQEQAVRRHLPALDGRLRFFDRFNDNPQVELDGLDLARERGPSRVVALAEVDLLRAARIKDRLSGGATNHEARTLLYRDKYLMKQRLAEHGIRVHPMAPIGSALDLRDFIDAYGYPVVAKPRDGRGSGGVRVLRGPEDLRAYLAGQPATTFHNLMVERFVDAPMYHVNGFYREGRPVFISPVSATIGCLEFLDGRSLGVAMLDPDDPLRARCVALARDIVERALPPQRTFLFYLELFLHEGDLVVCEIAARLGGNGVNQEIQEAFGINPRFELIRAERGVGRPAPRELLRPERLVGYISVPPREARLDGFPEIAAHPYVRSYRVTGERGRRYEKMKLTNAEIVCAVLEGGSEAELVARLREFDAWVARTFVWTP